MQLHSLTPHIHNLMHSSILSLPAHDFVQLQVPDAPSHVFAPACVRGTNSGQKDELNLRSRLSSTLLHLHFGVHMLIATTAVAQEMPTAHNKR